jgi:hypothetical protein
MDIDPTTIRAMILAPKPLTARLSPFERLPLEIRQMIYELLGYPVAGRIWTTASVPAPGGGSHFGSDIAIPIRGTITRYKFEYWDTSLLNELTRGLLCDIHHPLIAQDRYVDDVSTYTRKLALG